jgi:predicted esterase
VLQIGAPLEQARRALILIHGRGASAESILEFASELQAPGFAYLAPQAAGYTWYPNRFTAPIESNQPWLDSALRRIDLIVQNLTVAGTPYAAIYLLGFSQGACLALEYAARNPRRYGGVVGLSGGLIGPPGTILDHLGSMDGTPVFLGCSDRDPHIPKERVIETAAQFERMGADVDMRLYENMGHTVNQAEIEAVREILSR